ncbi:MAG TPA: MraY family glycosyltransferase [Pirellulales bacterium]
MTTLLAALVIAFLCSVVATRCIQRAAHRVGLVDRSDGHRKMQRQPVALGGGVAVLFGLLAALAAVLLLPNHFRAALRDSVQGLIPIVAACAMIVVLGLIDDRYTLRGRHKLLGQVAIALLLAMSGFTIHAVRLFDYDLQLGLLAVPFSVFWLLGAMNALNLIDGIDGLAGSVGVILSMAIAGLCLMHGHAAEGIVAWIFAGSLLGFLCFNFPPAKIYLGDAGSMLIGLLIGTLAIRASLKGPATVALAAPLAVWAVPILDVIAAIARRKLTGRSIYTTDRGHLHHRLLAATGSNVLVVGVVSVACVVTCVGAALSARFSNDLLALACVLPVVGAFVATRVFGYVELLLVANRMKSAGRSLLRPLVPSDNRAREALVRLQGTRPWDELWESLAEFAGKLSLVSMRLEVSVPAVHEDFHATWQRPWSRDPQELWRTEIPFFARARLIGRLSVAGSCDDGPASECIERLTDMMQSFESRLVKMATADANAERQFAEADNFNLLSAALKPEQVGVNSLGELAESAWTLKAAESSLATEG